MALSTSTALITAHYRSMWNRATRDQVRGARWMSAVVIVITAVCLAPPAFMLLSVGLATGKTLAQSRDPESLALWSGLQALLAVGFAIFGSFRMKPAFPASRFAPYPLNSVEVLIAEIPSSLAEAFPILGVGGILMANAGLALAMPKLSPLILLMTILAIITFIATMFILSAILSIIGRSGVATVATLAVVVATPFALGLQGLRSLINVWLPRAVDALPLTKGYAGAVAFGGGDLAGGTRLITWSVAATAVLFFVAAAVHHSRMNGLAESSVWHLRRGTIRFGTAAGAIGQFYFRQIITSTVGRSILLISFFMVAPIVAPIALGRRAIEDGRILPEEFVRMIDRVSAVPMFAVVPLLIIVVMGAQIWVNQFGFDSGSIRGLLVLPITGRDILAGKAIGLSTFFVMQLGVSIAPLFFLPTPAMREVLVGASVAIAGAVVAIVVGQLLSVRFPRQFSTSGIGTSLPMYLTWIPIATAAGLGAVFIGIWAIGEAIGRNLGVALLVLASGLICLAYRAALPRLGEWMMENRERLLAL